MIHSKPELNYVLGLDPAVDAPSYMTMFTTATAALKEDMFTQLFSMQEKLGKKFNNFKRISKSKYQRQLKTMEFIGHVNEELVEMKRELPIRKDWSKRKKDDPDWDKVLVEYVDALHFFISIALLNGWTAEQVFDAYCAKNTVNHKRIKENY